MIEYLKICLIKIININLDFYYELCYHKVKESDKLWKLFTIEDEQELKSLVRDEKLLNGYQNKLLYLSDNEGYKKMIMNEDIERNAMLEQQFGPIYDEAYDKGEVKGFERGIEQGTLNAKKELINSMYKDKVSLDVISKYTGLSINEINNIINELK